MFTPRTTAALQRDREITQLVIRIDRLSHHSNRQTLIRKLEERLIREALS